MIKLKSPALVFWVGTFLFGAFGVSRFMIGDRVLGIIYGLLWLVNWIWWIVDMFLVGKKLRKQNFEKIANIIQ
ncbi:TM2 domain-containing protein [Campylobacter jejuni]|nr:TM2 domain-containing protein [Campylobacter jejuni]